MTVACAIPARYASTRLEGKPLLEIAGRPMIEHVYRRAAAAQAISRVVVLTDDERIGEAVERFGGAWQMTPADCPSGTDRIAWACASWSEGGVINLQGDEPLIDPAEIDTMARHLQENPDDAMITLAAPCEGSELDDPDVVKVVCDRRGYALYFSRAPIPFPRRDGGAAPLRHVGIYGYRRDILLQIAGTEPTPLELCESLEQLRALESGIPIRVLPSRGEHVGVDTPADLERVREMFSE